ncbi:hypothetical protein ACKWTF_011642 [Chironomus riparius]
MKHENQFFLFLKDVESAESYLGSNKGYPFYYRQLKTVEHKTAIKIVYKSVMNDETCTEDQKIRVWKLHRDLNGLLVEIQSEGNPGNKKRHAESEADFIPPKKHIISCHQASNLVTVQNPGLKPLYQTSSIMHPQNCEQQLSKQIPYPFNLAIRNSSLKFFNPLSHSTPKNT